MEAQPGHHTILVLDIEQYSQRSDSEQMDLRALMHQCLYQAMDEAGLSSGQFLEFARGDGVLIAVPDHSRIARRQFVDPFIPRLHGALAATSGAMPIRMRMAMHCGDIHIDANDIGGHAVDATFHLCNSPQLRQVLAASRRSRLAVAASDVWYQTVLRPNHDRLPTGKYREAQIVTRKYQGRAWLHVPGYDSPQGVDEAGAEAPDGTPPAAATTDHDGTGDTVHHYHNRDQRVDGNQFQGSSFRAESSNFGGSDSASLRLLQDLDRLIVEVLCGSFAPDYARDVIAELASARRALAAGDMAKVRVGLERARDSATPISAVVTPITASLKALNGRS